MVHEMIHREHRVLPPALPRTGYLLTMVGVGAFTFLLGSDQCIAQDWKIGVDKTDNAISFTSSPPGEGQSTVVQPVLKTECPAGRFGFTNDRTAFRPPTTGAVQLRDLTGSNSAITLST